MDHIKKHSKQASPSLKIKYRAERLLQLSYGKPDLDAYKFINLAEKEASEKGGFFSMEVNPEIYFKGHYTSQILCLHIQNISLMLLL